MNALLDQPPFPVLAHFAPNTSGLSWQRAAGGFSGAQVWRGALDAPRIALKAWPPGTSVERLQQIHAWIAQAHSLTFVPGVLPGAGGRTVFAHAGQVWDCSRWLPGTPRAQPTAAEVVAACEAVAHLHAAWAGEIQRGSCPGVANRLRAIAENESLLHGGPALLPPVSPQLDPLLRRAVIAAARVAPLAVRALRLWEGQTLTLQPCVRDLRGEHVLFEAGEVRGIIDYGAMAVDHPAVDLARLLTDYAATDDARFAAALAAYRDIRGAVEVADEFVRVLARSGAICSLLGWLMRLTVRREAPADPLAVAARIELLISRVALDTQF